METTIKIVKLFPKSGIGKNQKSYKKVSLWDGINFYTTFEPSTVDNIKAGQMVTLDVEQGQDSHQFKILKIIAYGNEAIKMPDAVPEPTVNKTNAAGADNSSSRSGRLEDSEAPAVAIDLKVRDRLKKARLIVAAEVPDAQGMSEYPYLLGQVLYELGSEERQEKMIKMDIEKMKAYGR